MKEKILAVCSKCQDEFLIQAASLSRVIRRTGSYQCIICALEQKRKDPVFIENQKIGSKNSWTEERRHNQSEISKKLWDNPDFHKKLTDASNKAWADSDKRKVSSELVTQLWRDPSYRKNRDKIYTDVEWRRKNSENIKEVWKKPEYREKFIKLWASDEFKNKLSECAKELWKDPKYRNGQIQKQKERWNNDEYREKMAHARATQYVKRDSILERVTQQLLVYLGINYIRHHVIGPYEFDVFVPNHNLLIECQGEYWHSLDKAKRVDSSKITYINEYFHNFRLLYLYERDFLNPGIIKQKLMKSIFNDDSQTTQVDFSFFDLKIRKLDSKIKQKGSYYSESEEFLQSFHYAGFGRSAKLIYGCYLDDKLISICKFSNAVRKEVATSMGLKFSDVLELDRFCINPVYQKKNFATWFMSRCSKLAFDEFSSIKCLVSFADTTYGHFGTIYKAGNWIELHRTNPDYYYISKDGFVVHKKTLYGHARSMKKTEKEYVDEFGYGKILGKEKIKFVLNRSC